MKKFIIISSLFSLGLLITISSCKKHDAMPADCSTTLSYAKDIQPILAANCTISGCHNGSQKPDLRQYSDVKSETSKIKSTVSSGSMPRGGSLSTADKNALLCWIANGAANN